ncbi:hypothetical protein ST47_g997 [Ascochyta rabiei]|uniref:Uncharacterized protein n=1 Tax=Didymella rabiei TaxID=5454 RepID=A0A163LJX9_DIDRA|nr:hypothetical protein ST47_g997 [Ascochyta rabiei]
MSTTAIDQSAISYQEKWLKQSLLLYKASPGISYLFLIATAVHHIFDKEGSCNGSRCTFWQHQAVTSFAQSGIMTLVYWVVLLALQVVYLLSLWSTEMVYYTVAVKLSAHYIASNLLLVAFMHLWVRQDF